MPNANAYFQVRQHIKMIPLLRRAAHTPADEVYESSQLNPENSRDVRNVLYTTDRV